MNTVPRTFAEDIEYFLDQMKKASLDAAVSWERKLFLALVKRAKDRLTNIAQCYGETDRDADTP